MLCILGGSVLYTPASTSCSQNLTRGGKEGGDHMGRKKTTWGGKGYQARNI